MKYFDSHSHLNFNQYNADRDTVVSRMLESDVATICVGTGVETSRESVELAQKNKNIWASVGIHPTEVRGGEEFKHVQKLAQEARVVAVGECGLDYFRSSDDETKRLQNELFLKHVELARQLELPVIIHCRPSAGSEDAYNDLYSAISGENLTGTVHFFVGSPETAQKFLDLGFHISFAGPITFTDEYDRVIETVPLDRILIETDAPFASPAPYRGKRNEPSYVIEVARKISQIKNVSLEEVADKTLNNAIQLFRLTI